jgi:hypothetical protein
MNVNGMEKAPHEISLHRYGIAAGQNLLKEEVYKHLVHKNSRNYILSAP